MIDRKLKILLTVHCFFPRHYCGTERYTLELAKCLQNMGHEVVVMTANTHPEDSRGQDFIEYSFEGIRVISIDLVHLGEISFRSTYERPQLDPIFRRILWQEKPDLMHCCHLLYLGGTLIAEAKKARVPVVCTLTDLFCICWTNKLITLKGKPCVGPKYNGLNCLADYYGCTFWSTRMARHVFERGIRNFAGKLKRILKEKPNLPSRSRFPVTDVQFRKERLHEYYRYVDRFLVATDFLKDAYVSNGYPPDRFTKLTFGINQPSEADKILLEKRYVFKKHGTPFVFGFIGQVAHHKGIDLLIKAFREADLAEAELHIYGDLDQEEDMKRFILSACEQDHRIRCLGTFPGEEIYHKLTSIHALCIPSVWGENAPLILLNALASKTLVIVSDGKGLVEFVQDGANGIVFKSRELKRLIHALERACAHRHEWGRKLQNQAGYTVSPADYSSHVLKIYREILEDREPPSFREPESIIQPTLRIKPLRCDTPACCTTRPHEGVPGTDAIVPNLSVEQPQFPLECRIIQGQSTIPLSLLPGFGSASKIKARVRFSQGGLTVFYYTLNPEDHFSEDHKLTHPVVPETDYELTLQLHDCGKHMCQLRWDVIYGAQDCLLTFHDLQLVDGKLFERDFTQGCHGVLEDWLWINSRGVFEHEELRPLVAPFPPDDLVQVTSGVDCQENFAKHGVDIFSALDANCVKPLLESKRILDFGCGCGRLSRMFKGFRGELHGCDIDRRLVNWMQKNLTFMKVKQSSVRPPLPYDNSFFDTIISISIFSHLKESDQDLFLRELARVSAPGGQLLITVHGERALQRAREESRIFEMLSFDAAHLDSACEAAASAKHYFIRQEGHLTTIPKEQSSTRDLKHKAINDPYEYGIAFVPESYVYDHWSKFFNVIRVVKGGIHDFQDIVVLQNSL
jgi:glycosyltransferase involved in cell wall biosynthesis/cyclopropane fatty-acyl-phospholipid synthase-like methyltransferase